MASCTPTTTARAAATNSAAPFSIPTNRLGRECGDSSGPSDRDTVLAPDVFPCVALLLGVRILGSLARLECCAETGFASVFPSTGGPFLTLLNPLLEQRQDRALHYARS